MGNERLITRRGFAGGLSALAIGGALLPAGTRLASAQDKFKIAFVYVGPVSDDGWTYAHDQGRKALEAAVPGLSTTYQENVPENAADAERVIRDFAQKGNKIVFTTSFGYMDPTFNVAKDFPNTVFIHISGYKTAPNMGTGFAKIEEPRYVTGLIAGKMTKTNKIGYVAAFPIPEVIRGLNAFTLGIRKANPTATVKVVWTNTWFNPQVERAAAEALLDGGVDITGQHEDSPATLQADEAKGVYGIGYDADMSTKVPKAAITSPIFIWAPFYIQTVKAVMDGSWKTSQYWGGWKDGAVDLAPFGAMVPDDVKQMAMAEAAKFKSGAQTIFTVFTGPLKDNAGKDRVPAGQAMTDKDLLSMNWLVEGVDGKIPG